MEKRLYTSEFELKQAHETIRVLRRADRGSTSEIACKDGMSMDERAFVRFNRIILNYLELS